MNFLMLLEQELEKMDDVFDEELLDLIEDSYDESEVDILAEDLGITLEDAEFLMENIKKRVDAAGTITKIRSRDYRSRHAVQTTGLSKAMLKQRARRAAKTRRRSPSILRRSIRKRAKAMRRRKQMGIK